MALVVFFYPSLEHGGGERVSCVNAAVAAGFCNLLGNRFNFPSAISQLHGSAKYSHLVRREYQSTMTPVWKLFCWDQPCNDDQFH